MEINNRQCVNIPFCIFVGAASFHGLIFILDQDKLGWFLGTAWVKQRPFGPFLGLDKSYHIDFLINSYKTFGKLSS